MRGDGAEVADDADPGEEFQDVEGDVNLPPEEALACGGHVVVVVIVPAFAEGDQGKDETILAGVGGEVAARAEEVRERIDGEGAVPEHHGAEAEAPEEESPPTDEIEDHGEDHGRHEVIFIEPAQLGVLREVADVFETSVVVLVGDEPADMRPEKAKQRGGVEIVFGVRIAVVMAVMRGPPEDALLAGGHGQPGDDELEDAAGLEGAVRKIAVIARGHEKHASVVERQASDEIGPVKLHKENTQHGEVDQGKRQGMEHGNARAIRKGYK